MSTAIVSSFPDVRDALLQNQNMTVRQVLSLLPQQEKAVWGQSTHNMLSQSRTRNSSGSSNSSSGSQGSSKYNPAAHLISFPTTEPGSSPPAHPHLRPATATGPGDLTGVVPHRKLDRSVSEPAGADRNNNKNVNSSRYKTELCRPFEENGFCKYGDKCQFAHGENELRNLNRHPKYKTELCRTYHSVGFCPYGPRCHFIHNEDERKLSQISQQKQHQAQQAATVQQQQQLQVVQQLLAQAQQQQQQQRVAAASAPRPAPTPSTAKALNFSLSLPAMVRDSLGSTADSPPSSLRGSPTLSPMSMLSDDLMSSASSTLSGISMFSTHTPPPQSAPPGFTSAFTFPQQPEGGPLSGSMPPVAPPTPPSATATGLAPLNVQTNPDPMVASLAAEMQAATLQAAAAANTTTTTTTEVLRDCLGDVFSSFMPPSPAQSLEDGQDNTLPPTPTSAAPSCGSPMDLSRSLRLPIFSQLATPSDN